MIPAKTQASHSQGVIIKNNINDQNFLKKHAAQVVQL